MQLKNWNCINFKKKKKKKKADQKPTTSRVLILNALVHLQQSRAINLSDREPLSRAAKSLFRPLSEELTRTEKPIRRIVIYSVIYFPVVPKKACVCVLMTEQVVKIRNSASFLNIINNVEKKKKKLIAGSIPLVYIIVCQYHQCEI